MRIIGMFARVAPFIRASSTRHASVLPRSAKPQDGGWTAARSKPRPESIGANTSAAALERPRSWVMLRALRQYLDDGEGREIEQDTESIAELDRGESVPFEEVLNRLRERVARAEAASKK